MITARKEQEDKDEKEFQVSSLLQAKQHPLPDYRVSMEQETSHKFVRSCGMNSTLA